MMIQHNLAAMNANRMYNNTVDKKKKSAEKLSSGYKINRAADNAAGLSISEKMRRQIRGLDRGSTNSDDGISMVQTAEGALNEVHDMLHRMNELAVQAANGTNSESDRQAIQDEISQIESEIDRVAESTKFNEEYLLKGGHTETTKRVWAHDAGLKGKLSQGEIISSFEMKRLLSGDQIQVGPVKYTVGTGKGDVQKLIAEEAKGGDTVKVRSVDGEYDIDTYHIIELEEENGAEAQQVSYIQGTMSYGSTEQVDIGKTDGVEKYELIDTSSGAHAELKSNVISSYNGNGGKSNTKEVTITAPGSATGTTYDLLGGSALNYFAETRGNILSAFDSDAGNLNKNTDVTIGEGGTQYHVLKSSSMISHISGISGEVVITGGSQAGTYTFDSTGKMLTKNGDPVETTGTIKTNINNAIQGVIDSINSDVSTSRSAWNSDKSSDPSPAGGITFSWGSASSPTITTARTYSGTTTPAAVSTPVVSDIYDTDGTHVIGTKTVTTTVPARRMREVTTTEGTASKTGTYSATVDGVTYSFSYTVNLALTRKDTTEYDQQSVLTTEEYTDGRDPSTVTSGPDYSGRDNETSSTSYDNYRTSSVSYNVNGNSYGAADSAKTAITDHVVTGKKSSYRDRSGVQHDNELAVSTRSMNSVLNSAAGADKAVFTTSSGSKTYTKASEVRQKLSDATNTTGTLNSINSSRYYTQAYNYDMVRGYINGSAVNAYSDPTTTVSITNKNGSSRGLWTLRDYNYSSVYNMLSDGAFENSRYEDGDVYGIRVAVTNSGDTREYTAETTHYRQKECVAYGEDEEDQIDTPGAERDDLFFGAQRVDFHGKSYVLMVDQDHNGYDDQDYHIVDEGRAYKIIANELTVASSIGCDVDKPVVRDKNNNDIVDNVTMAADFLLLPDEENSTVLFNIERGTTRVKKDKNIEIHAGTDADMNNKISVDLSAMSAAGLGIKGINVKDSTGYQATYAIDAIETAIMEVSSQRSLLGAAQNRMEHTIKNLDNVVENTTASESRIRDTDIADEMVKNSTADILAQAGQAMLSQANQTPQGVLNLLG